MMLNADVRKGWGRGADQMRTPAERGRGVGKGVVFVDVLYGRPLWPFFSHLPQSLTFFQGFVSFTTVFIFLNNSGLLHGTLLPGRAPGSVLPLIGPADVSFCYFD